jgi:hypothetical protein
MLPLKLLPKVTPNVGCRARRVAYRVLSSLEGERERGERKNKGIKIKGIEIIINLQQ